MKLMQLCAIVVAAFSLFSCGSDEPDPPNISECTVNAPGKKLTCYDFLEDYDKYGKLKADATPEFRPAPDIWQLNKAWIVSAPDGKSPMDGFIKGRARLEAYVKTMREEYAECRKEVKRLQTNQ